MAEQDIATDETRRLIASDKVEGTAVYDRSGDRLGTILNFMVDKRTGRVEYAVLSFGGFLGIGENHHPLPWDVLDYDVEKGGYRVDLDKSVLEQSPRYEPGRDPAYDHAYGREVYGYYGLPYPMM